MTDEGGDQNRPVHHQLSKSSAESPPQWRKTAASWLMVMLLPILAFDQMPHIQKRWHKRRDCRDYFTTILERISQFGRITSFLFENSAAFSEFYIVKLAILIEHAKKKNLTLEFSSPFIEKKCQFFYHISIRLICIKYINKRYRST